MFSMCFYSSVSFALTLLFTKEFSEEEMSICFSFILDKDSQYPLSS